ncbi:MAG: hypothetical protein NTW66_04010 [Candidatus Magasanikbacteria bacterium]|nr:hypothetical protein [Candidatus Magasanikbacteria bacterium]
MFPNYHLTDYAFWAGFILLLILLAILVGKQWAWLVVDFKKKDGRGFDAAWRHFRIIFLLTVVFIISATLLVIGQGQTASTQNAELNPPTTIRSDFVESQKGEAAALVPKTATEMLEERARAEEEKREGKVDDHLRTNREVGNSMSDFRTKMLNRDNPGATTPTER